MRFPFSIVRRKRYEAALAALTTCKDVHGPYADLAQQIMLRINTVVDEQTKAIEAALSAGEVPVTPDLSTTLSAVLDGLTHNATVAKLRAVFGNLPVTDQWRLLLTVVDNETVALAIKKEQERLHRLADPVSALAEALAESRRTGYINLNALPRDVRVEIDLCRALHIASAEGSAVKHKDCRRWLTLQSTGLNGGLVVLADILSKVVYEVDDRLKRQSTVYLGSVFKELNGDPVRRIYRGAALDVEGHKDPMFYRSDNDYRWYMLYVAAVRLNGQDAFDIPPTPHCAHDGTDE